MVALLDTVVPGEAGGRLTASQLDWLDELGERADRPVLVFGHHHPWAPGSRSRPSDYFGINPDDSEALVAVVARRPALIGYFAGHTHRNRVRRFPETGDVPWTEVACVKDFPGSWAEYRVFEGGVLQIHRRIASEAALAWSEACRAMIGGLYPGYAFGELEDRCLAIWPRRP
jgi:Icc protein